MGEVINLNRVRKERKQTDEVKRSGENRARFGRSKDEKAREKNAQQRSLSDLDGKKLS